MLRQRIGTETFWNGMRAYYERYRHDNARTRDFRAVMEEVSGQNLTPFFDRWTRRPGHPVLEGTWRHDAATGTCAVTLRQTQVEAPFRVPVEVAVETADDTTRTTVRADGRTTQARLDCPQPPAAVTLDPHTRLLAELSLTKAG